MYPRLEINIKHIKYNLSEVVGICHDNNIQVTGVIKGCGALDKVTQCFVESDCFSVGSSRIRQLRVIKESFDKDTMLLRLPMLSEVNDVVRYADISLNSELDTLKALNIAAKMNQVKHGVVLMYDVGDLREGIWEKDSMVHIAKFVERAEYLDLKGVGTNVGCYGSVKPSFDNLSELVEVASAIEQAINRKLEIISGGATSTLSLLNHNQIPDRINHLRLGESILLGKDLPQYYGCDFQLYDDTFVLKAQLVEVKEKPSYPIGDLMVNAFGNKPIYKDRGVEKRGLLAIGKQDFGHHDKLIALDESIKIIGSSSDHLIVSIEGDKYKVGDSILFEMFYQPMLFLSLSPDVEKLYML